MLKSDAVKRLKEARWAKGWSRRQLSEATTPTVSESTITKLELGDTSPFPQTIYTLARALDLNPDDLIEEEAAS